MDEEIWIAFDELNGALLAADFQNPQATYVWCCLIFSQAARELNLDSMRFEICQMSGLSRLANVRHFRPIFKDDCNSHTSDVWLPSVFDSA